MAARKHQIPHQRGGGVKQEVAEAVVEDEAEVWAGMGNGDTWLEDFCLTVKCSMVLCLLFLRERRNVE